MTRRFFDQVDDELRGFLGPSLRDFRALRTSRLIKIWYDDPQVHFEAQRISERWAPRGKPAMEIGLHFEFPSPQRNEEMIARLTERPSRWARKLPKAKAGRAFGPNADAWRRLSEVVPLAAADEEDLAGEVAQRLAGYVRTLRPLIQAP